MTKKQFLNLVRKGIILLDGSSGVELQNRGMPSGVCPEKWALENPEILINLQKEYINSGSKIIYTFTFGGNPQKLKEFHLHHKTFEINKKLAIISKRAALKKAYVAGNIAPTGIFPEPFGEIDFEYFVELYKKQVIGLLAGGVDLFVIETMMDLQETRAAIFAIKELCNLPIIVSMTFDENKRTLTGSTPESIVVSLQDLGIDAIGVNCSTGPKEIIEIIKLMRPYAKIPLIAKPNAGIPELKNNKTIFSMGPDEFAFYTHKLIDAGANLIGGCCGTNPKYIQLINQKLKSISFSNKNYKINTKNKNINCLSTYKSVLELNNNKFIIIGEKINPTGKKSLQKDLKSNNFSILRDLAIEQIENGANLLDVNVGIPGIDEKELMVKVINFLTKISDVPLCIDSSSPETIEKALRIYPGRALINSISLKRNKMLKLLHIAKKYGALFILLPINDKEIPETSIKRIKNIKKALKIIKKYNFKSSDLIIDAITLALSTNYKSGKETLKVIKWLKKSKLNSIIGLSNISFGLPGREIINSTFLYLCKKAGLKFAILNPSANFKVKNPDAINLLLGKDKNCLNWLNKYKNYKSSNTIQIKTKTKSIFDAIVNAEKEIIYELIENEIKKNVNPKYIINKFLIPAINYVGDLYEKKIFFLPQLIASADTFKLAFSKLEPLLNKSNYNQNNITIILATVKGDIHDIGKNIVSLVLKNYGYKIYDLGKDVPSNYIIQKAIETKADIIGLSALMTTTMLEMKNVINLAKKYKLKSKIIIGGAVVTKSFAEEIGADGYAKDAFEAVKLIKKLFS